MCVCVCERDGERDLRKEKERETVRKGREKDGQRKEKRWRKAAERKMLKKISGLEQGWPNHCPGAKNCPPRHFHVPFDLF